MSDKPVSPPVAPAGQPAAPGQGPTEPASQVAPDPKAIFNEARSQFDKYVDARLKKLATALDETPAAQPVQAVMGGQSPQGQAPNAETQWARNVEAVFGVTLDLTDPESALLIEGQTPAEYKKNYLEAMRAKKARTSQPPAGAQPPAAPPTTPTTAGGSGAPVPPPDLMDKYKAEVAQPGLTAPQRLNIRDKYRRLGLRQL